jgi:hypothetical protein
VKPLDDKKMTLREHLEKRQYNLPVSEQEAFLDQQAQKIGQDLDRWKSKLASLEASLAEGQRLNDGVVDEAVSGYLDGSNPEELSLKEKPVEFQDRHLKVSISKYRRLIEHGEGALIYCRREGRRIADSLLNEKADALTREVVSKGEQLAKQWLQAEDSFMEFTQALTELFGLDSEWGNRVHKLGLPTIFAEIAGLRKLHPASIEVAKLDDIIALIRRLGARDGVGNPFVRRDGQQRFVRTTSDLHREQYFENAVSKLQPKSREAFEQGLSRLAESLI